MCRWHLRHMKESPLPHRTPWLSLLLRCPSIIPSIANLKRFPEKAYSTFTVQTERTMHLKRLMIMSTAVLKIEIAVAMAVNGTNPPTQLPSASFSYISGPFMNGPSITWEKAYNAITVGTVVVTVQKNSSQIGSTTMYGTEYTNSPNASLYRPESTNSAGTRTSDGWRTTPRMTYPTNYYGPRSELTWAAVLPITTPGLYSQLRADNWEDQYPFEYNIPDVGKEGTCCFTSFIVQPMPTSIRIVQDAGSTDSEDPRG